MEKLKKFAFDLLNRDSLQFHVMDCATGKYIPGAKKINQKFLDEHHQGDITKYLKTLFNVGFTEIQVVPRKSNGSTDVPFGPAITINCNDTQTPENKPMQLIPEVTPKQTTGLGYAEFAQGFAAQESLRDLRSRFDKLETEKIRIEKDLGVKTIELQKKETEEKVNALEMKQLKKKIKKEKNKKPSALNQMAQGLGTPGGITSLLAAAPQIIAMFKGANNNQQPQNETQENNLSDWQNTIVGVLEGAPDPVCEKIYKVIVKLNEKDPHFSEKLNELLELPSNLQKVQ